MKNNEFNKIDELFNKDSQSINTPSELKDIFFEENGNIKSGLTNNLKPYFIYLFIAVSLISIGSFQLFDIYSNTKNKKEYAKKYSVSKKGTKDNYEINKDKNIIPDSQLEKNSSIINVHTEVKKAINEAETSGTKKINNLIKPNATKRNFKKSYNNFNLNRSNYDGINFSSLSANRSDFNPREIKFENRHKEDFKPSNLSITLRGFNNDANIKTNLNTNKNSIYNDLNINFYFYRYKNITFGAGIGRENLPQRYSGELNNDNVLVTQNPNIYWFSLNARYYPELLSYNSLNTFIEGGVGITPYGSMLRSNIGVEYDLGGNTSVFLAADLSNFSYSYQNNIFFTNKIGFTYGIRVKL